MTFVYLGKSRNSSTCGLCILKFYLVFHLAMPYKPWGAYLLYLVQFNWMSCIWLPLSLAAIRYGIGPSNKWMFQCVWQVHGVLRTRKNPNFSGQIKTLYHLPSAYSNHSLVRELPITLTWHCLAIKDITMDIQRPLNKAMHKGVQDISDIQALKNNLMFADVINL